MKNRTLHLMLSVFAAFITLAPIAACKSKKQSDCDTINCFNGGTCNNGTCSCPEGYTGNICQTEVRSSYLGQYNLHGTSRKNNDTSIVITNMSLSVRDGNGLNGLKFYFNNSLTSNLTGLLESNYTSFDIPREAKYSTFIQGSGNFAISGGDTTVSFTYSAIGRIQPYDTTVYTLSGAKY